MKPSELKTDFFNDDDDILTASVQREFDLCVGNPSNHSESTMDDLDNSRSLPYSHQPPPPPPIPKVKQTPDESPEKKYNASIIGCVLLMTAFILGVLSICMELDIIKLNKEKNILSESASVLKEKLSSELWDIQKIKYGNSPHIVVKESNSKKVKKSMHRYSKDHAHYSMLSKNSEIPIFLDLPGTNTISFTESLTKCLGVKGISTTLFMEDFDKNISPQSSFLTLSSLCGLHNESFKDVRSRVFMSVQNPMLNIIQKYNEMNRNPNNSPQYDAEASNLNLIDYLNSSSATFPENSNALTRAILCKPQAELNDNHLNIVRTFLNEKAYIGDFKDFTDATIKFQRRFKWWRNSEKKSSLTIPMLSVSDCMKNHHSTHLEKEERLLQRYDDTSTNEQKQLLHMIIDTNFYDYSIYMDYEKQKKNADFGKNNVRNLGTITRNQHR